MADTCGTLVKAAAVLKENGAKSVLALVTHGILSGNAIETLNGSVLSALVVTNTVPLGDKVERCPKLRVIDISPTIAEAIRRTHNGRKTSIAS
jgi:ribose-phosphate pyrophosphokinase